MTANAAMSHEDQGGVMPARMHTRPHSTDGGAAEIQLPWWAIALPSAAFLLLLLLILNPANAHATTSGPALTHLLQSLQHALLDWIP